MIEITWKWLEDNKYPSVTDFCRFLVTTRSDWTGVGIKIYRNEMLCLTVKDINKMAELMPSDRGWRKYDKTKRKAP